MSKANNLTDFLGDVADAIRAKKGSSALINPQNFSAEIASIDTGGGGGNYTGHADAEGLRAIGWTEDDIAYYQTNGVNWNEEDDQYHLVSDDNKALYGALTASNISTYKDRIVYLPKIDTSSVTSMDYMFEYCRSLVAIPTLDTSNVTSMVYMFSNCYSLVSIPILDTSNVVNMNRVFYSCYSLTNIPTLDTSHAGGMEYMFSNCYSLVSIPALDTSRVQTMRGMFSTCRSLVSIDLLNISRSTNMNSMFYNCNSLTVANLLGIQASLTITDAVLFSKEALLYIINNEAATSAITITLASYAYTRLANDADIVEALANHPNISIAQ